MPSSPGTWAIAGVAASIGLLFLPGGICIDAAVGAAIAANAHAEATELGRAADTGLHVADGLVSQSQAWSARFAAVLSTVFAVPGGAAAGFRVLRFGLALRALGSSTPNSRSLSARAVSDDAALFSTITRLSADDAAVVARVVATVRRTAGNPRAMRLALEDVAAIARIPRRVAAADLYEPFRRITDGSDVARVAREIGLSRAEVEASKRNLMLDEHVLVDATGALYRGALRPFPSTGLRPESTNGFVWSRTPSRPTAMLT